VETVIFLRHFVDIVPAEMIPSLFLQGAVTAALFSPLVVLVHGKMKKNEDRKEGEPVSRLEMPWETVGLEAGAHSSNLPIRKDFLC
jgi:hypothetical protein